MVAFSTAFVFAALAFFQSTAANDFQDIKAVDHRQETPTLTTSTFGSKSGKFFTDFGLVTAGHRRVTSVHMLGCTDRERLGQISLHYESLAAPFEVLAIGKHGSGTGGEKVVTLSSGEYISKIDVSSYQVGSETRVGSITVYTSGGTISTCGARDAQDPVDTWSFKGHAFLFFSGFEGSAGINGLTAKFLPLEHYF